MSSKQEIRDLFITELKTTPQYQIVLTLKQIILNEIATPNVVSHIVYNFETYQNNEELDIIKMCLIVEFGFSTENMSSNYIIIDMKDFLN